MERVYKLDKWKGFGRGRENKEKKRGEGERETGYVCVWG